MFDCAEYFVFVFFLIWYTWGIFGNLKLLHHFNNVLHKSIKLVLFFYENERNIWWIQIVNWISWIYLSFHMKFIFPTYSTSIWKPIIITHVHSNYHLKLVNFLEKDLKQIKGCFMSKLIFMLYWTMRSFSSFTLIIINFLYNFTSFRLTIYIFLCYFCSCDFAWQILVLEV